MSRRTPPAGRVAATRVVRALLLVLAGTLALTGCNFDVYKLPLPGGTDVGSDPITVTIQFDDVLDLVPKSSVKVDDVSVGRVTDVELNGYTAVVTVQIRKDTKLPDNAVAEIRQTSLLGEKFVSLSAPAAPSSTPLKSGDVIPIARTGRTPEVEEVLGALSLLLNGGGVAQLKTIADELNQTLGGREDAARSVLTQIDDLTTTLDDNKAQIVDAIDALNRLALSVRGQEDDIDSALDELPSALTSIDQQRHDLVTMLQALNHLGDVGVRVIQASKAATIDSFRQLQPVLTELSASGDNFVKAFNVFLTYPFVDEVVGRDPQVARNLQMGDYTNLSVTLDIDLSSNPSSNPTDVLPTDINPTQVLDDVQKCLQSGSLSSAACQKVLQKPQELAQLRADCQKPANRNKQVCQALNQIPGLTGSSGGGNPSLPGLPTSVPGLPGLGRAGTSPDAWRSPAEGGPTVGQLSTLFDPALVSLLVPGLMTGDGSDPTRPAATTATSARSSAPRRAGGAS